MRQPGDGAPRALIRGAGDLATGVALSLHHAGFRIVMTELGQPTAIRRTVAFSEAVFDGRQTVEGVTALLCDETDLDRVLERGNIAMVVDPESAIRAVYVPTVAVDAIIAKRNLGTTRDFAPIVIGCGPGFRAGEDVDAVVETMRGHELGRVIRSGSAQENTGVPGEIGGRTRGKDPARAHGGPRGPQAADRRAGGEGGPRHDGGRRVGDRAPGGVRPRPDP